MAIDQSQRSAKSGQTYTKVENTTNMADVIQDVGVFSVKDELVFVDEDFCFGSPEEEVICITLDQTSIIENEDSSMSSNNDSLPLVFCDLDTSATCTAAELDPKEDSLIFKIMQNENQKPNILSHLIGAENNTYPPASTNASETVIKTELQEYQIINQEHFSNTNGYNVLTGDAANEIGFNPPKIKSESPLLEEFSYDESRFLKSSDLDFSMEDEMIEEKLDEDGKRKWACKHCGKLFVSRKGSIIHLRTHTGERPFACEICCKSFIDSSTLMKHKVIHMETRPYTCNVCYKGFNQKVALQRHESTHSLHPLYLCRYCPKTFLVQSSLLAHENIHSKVKLYECGFCPSRFHTYTLQKQHERVHTNERPYKCSYCPKAFKDSGTLFKHQVIHSGIKPYSCPLCSNGFTQKVAVRKHIRTHVMKANSKQCAICKITCGDLEELSFHLEQHVLEGPTLKVKSPQKSKPKIRLKPADEIKPPETDLSDLATLCDVAISTSQNFFANHNALSGHFACIYCGMSFKQQKTLNSHLRGIHLFCFFCSKKFEDGSTLEKHHCTNKKYKNGGSKSAKVAKQFFCEKCDKCFSSRNGFVIHQRSHTGERPYSCRWCDKAFGDSATRHKHERIHTGERPFKCTSCPRAFNQRAALRAHQVTHSCDRGFSCQFCPASFPYGTTLRKHVEASHSDLLQVTCPLCAASCADSQALHTHIQVSHVTGKMQECSLCDSGTFSLSEEYCDHLVWHAKQQMLTCFGKTKRRKRTDKRKYSID